MHVNFYTFPAMKKLTILALVVLTLGQCTTPEKKETTMNSGISAAMITKTIQDLTAKYGNDYSGPR